MAALTTLTDVPSVILAGDTLLFTIFRSYFPAHDGWSVVFSLRGKDGAIDATSTPDADNSKHLFSVDATTTAGWVPGEYAARAKAINGGVSTTFWQGTLRINPDLGSEPAGQDTRSWAKRCLDAVEAVLENKASKDVLNTTIAGQSIGRMTPEQLFALRDRFRIEYQNEQRALQAGQGKPQQSVIGITFPPLTYSPS